MPIYIPIILLAALLAGMLEGCSSKEKTDIPEGDTEESKDAIKVKIEPINQVCTCNARVICTSATIESEAVHIKKGSTTIEVVDLPKLNKKDIELETPFLGCSIVGTCAVSKDVIENQEWFDTDINRDKDNGEEPISYQTSYMICTVGPGIIYCLGAGQKLKDFIGQMKIDDIELIELAQFMKCLEIGDIYNLNNVNYEKNGKNIIGIKIQNAHDGYVTIAYGHAIQSNDDAKKYGFDKIIASDKFKDFEFSEKHSEEEINEIIDAHITYYKKMGIPNPAILSLEDAEILLINDLKGARVWAYSEIDSSKNYTKNQLDAITSVLYNGNKPSDKESISYHLINQLPETDTINILKKAIANNWYGEGTLRRRLMEFNIYYNDNYTFYDSGELNQLKKVTGYDP